MKIRSVRTAYPSLQYMCHLWPIRAVERYANLQGAKHKQPANPVLVLGSDLNPLSHPQYSDSVLRSLRGSNEEHREDADIVLQAQFGVCILITVTYLFHVHRKLCIDTKLRAWAVRK